MQACPYCSAPIDHAAAAASATDFALLNQSISDARFLRTMVVCALGFLLLVFVPFFSHLGAWAFIFFELAVPFMCGRWWLRYRRLSSPDPEFRRARNTAIAVSAIAALLLCHRIFVWI